MRSRAHKTVAAGVAVLLLGAPLVANEARTEETPGRAGVEESGRQQLILWTSGDREVALKMVFMYVYNCKKRGWMDHVRLLVWGPSAKLLSVDSELQAKLAELESVGVELLACKGCSDSYGVSEKLEELGITVRYTGEELAEMQKAGWHMLTF